MVESSKILTVSYGTFSCTLEGFDDSFSTMKAIAEYFRDLAAGDRYFGAEPPIPDAEMLGRIAEREISRRVEARTSDGGVHLRAAPLSIADVPAMPPEPKRPDAAPAMADLAEAASDDKPSLRVIENDAAAKEAARAEKAEAKAEAARVEKAEAEAEAAREAAEAQAAERAAAEAEAAAQVAAAQAQAAEAAAEAAAAKVEAQAVEADAAAQIAAAEAAAAEATAQAAAAKAEAEAAKAEIAAQIAATEAAEAAAAQEKVEAIAEGDDTIATFDEMELVAEGDADAFAEFTPIDVAPAHIDPSSVAAKLQLIQAVVGQADTLGDDDYAEDETEVVVQEDDAEIAVYEEEAEVALDDSDVDSAVADHAEELADSDAMEADDTVELDDVVAEADDDSETDAEDDVDDTDAQITNVLRNLERSGASTSDEIEFKDAEEDTLSEMIDAVGEDDADDADIVAEDGADEAEEVEAEKPSLRSRILRLASFGGSDDAADDDDLNAEADDDADDIADLANMDAAAQPSIDDLHHAASLAGLSSATTTSVATLDGADEMNDYDDVVEAELSPEDEAELQANLADALGLGADSDDNNDNEGEVSETDVAETDLSDDAADDGAADVLDVAELDEQDDTDTDNGTYVLEVAAADEQDDAETDEDHAAVAQSDEHEEHVRHTLPENDDAAMSRIMDQTDEELSNPEGNRRRNAIAQLKAAVAATEAARQLGDNNDDDAKKTEAFREDLNQTVRPRRPSVDGQTETRSERPRKRPAPLTLVASQRVDADGVATEDGPVRPRRITAEPVAQSDASSFAEFAEEMGASGLPDLLEAAAAYTAYVEGVTDFSRPQIMNKVQASTDEVFSREDGLRSFGTLLRQGRISKAGNGRFQVSEETRFKPEQKAG